MNTVEIAAAALTCGLFAYLLFAMLFPERFA